MPDTRKSQSKDQPDHSTEGSTRGTGPRTGTVIRAGDQPKASAAGVDEFVTMDDDVYEEFYFPNTTRPAYRLLYVKGERVRKVDVQRRLSQMPTPGGADNTPEAEAEDK